MVNLRKLTRTTSRPVLRTASHRLDRGCLRTFPGHRSGPDDLSQALTAFTRALRIHRRLARLAPRFFDPAVVEEEVRRRTEEDRRLAILDRVLDKVYGQVSNPSPAPDPVSTLPPLPSARTCRVVERELAELDAWLAAGRLALNRHHQSRPHAIPGLDQVVRLIRVAMQCQQLACGSRPCSRHSLRAAETGT